MIYLNVAGFLPSNTTFNKRSRPLSSSLADSSIPMKAFTRDPSFPDELETQIEQLLQSRHVRAIVISHVSHIDGRIFPIERLYRLTQSYHALLIVDGAQAVGHIPVSFHEWQPDAYFFPGHKWCAGPMGTGALVLGKRLSKRGEIANDEGNKDSQPPWAEFELGTQNLGLISGLAKACTIKQHEGFKTATLESIREEIRRALSETSGLKFLEWEGPHSPGILSFTCLDKQTESHLQSKPHNIVWKIFPLPEDRNRTGIRVSWSSDLPKRDLEFVIALFQNIG